MLRIRLLLAWLVLAALPLQGYAAATMLLCGPAGQRLAEAAQVPADGHAHDAAQGNHAHDHAGAHDHADGHAGPGDGSGDHTCGLCAASCHSIAIATPESTLVLPPAPRSALDEPFVLVHTRAPPVPDKPPRA